MSSGRAPKTKKMTKSELQKLLEEKEAELESLKRENELCTDRWKRALAELENFRKRKEKEEEHIRKFALEDILHKILPVVDNFERALAHIDKSNSIEALKQGVEMVYQQLTDLLKQYNVRRIDALAKEFDPNLHEAVQITDEDLRAHADKHIVVEEMLPGYKLHDRLLRPAKVKVSPVRETRKEKENVEE